MPKYYIGCEGSQDEFYSFLLDMAQKIDWAEHPWEHPSVERAMKPIPEPVNEVEVQEEEPEKIPEEPVEELELPAVSAEELQDKCVELGDKFGKNAFKELKEKAGFTSMKALDAEGRARFSAMIDRFMQENA